MTRQFNYWDLPREHQQLAVDGWIKKHFLEEKDRAAVFFTLKFHNIEVNSAYALSLMPSLGLISIDERHSERLLNRSLNELDRNFACARQVQRGERLKRAVFKHKGADGENLHFHGVVLINGDATNLADRYANIWSNMNRWSRWIDTVSSTFKVVDNAEAPTLYSAREVSKIGYEDSWMLKQSIILDTYSIKQQLLDRTAVSEKTRLLRELRLARDAELQNK